MKLCIVLLACLLLAACAPVVYITPAPSGPGDVLPVEAGHIVAQATASAAAMATQQAVATAARVSTLESITDSQTLATLAAAKTQDVIGATAAAATAQSGATSAAAATGAAQRSAELATGAAGSATAGARMADATSTAQLAAALATETVHREQQRTLVDTASGAMTALLKFLGAVGLAFGLWWLAGAIGADLTRRRNAAAYRDTPLGPVIMIADPRGMLTARLLTAPAAPKDEGGRMMDEEMQEEPVDPANLIEHTVNGHPAAPIVAEWRSPALDAERTAIAELVRAAIAVEGEAGTRIPRYSRLAGWQTNPDGWKALTDVLMRAGHVTKASGKNGGTFLTQGRTLYQLLAGLLDGSLPLLAVEVAGAAAPTLATT